MLKIALLLIPLYAIIILILIIKEYTVCQTLD